MEPLIIVGMHRSGTSLVAEILQSLGVFIGADLDDNYESDFFYQLNEWIFYQAGATWDNPKNLDYLTDNFISQIEKNLNKQVSSIKIKNYLGSFKDYLKYKSLTNLNFKWGWKDPRNTFTFDIWKKIFPELRIINIYRNPIDVAISLKNREDRIDKAMDTKTRTGLKKKYNEFYLKQKRLYKHSLRAGILEEGIKLWDEYVSKTLPNHWENQKIHHLYYEDLIETPRKEIEKLVNFAGLDIGEQKIQKTIDQVKKRPKYSFVVDRDIIHLGYQHII